MPAVPIAVVLSLLTAIERAARNARELLVHSDELSARAAVPLLVNPHANGHIPTQAHYAAQAQQATNEAGNELRGVLQRAAALGRLLSPDEAASPTPPGLRIAE